MKCSTSTLALSLLFVFACDPVQASGPISATNAAPTRAPGRDSVEPLQKLTVLATDPQDDRLTILLHGYGSNERDLPSLAERFGLQGPVISYQAPIELQTDRYAWFARDLRAEPTAATTDQFEASVDRLVASIEAERAEHPGKRVVVAGFSQGAMMTATLAAEHGDLVDFAVVLSGAMPRDLGSSAGKPHVFVAHGDADRVVEKEAADRLAQALEQKELDVAYKVYPGMGHRILPAVTNDVRAWLEVGR